MKQLIFIFFIVLQFSPSSFAQSLNSSNGGFEKFKTIDGKKYRILYYDYEIEKSPQEVWNEVAGNYINVGQIALSINASHCESGDQKTGVGAKRFCDINFQGKSVKVKERITEWKEEEDLKEFSYYVYESKGFPAIVYNTWIVRKGKDGKTYLANVFIFRGKPHLFTGMIGQKLSKLKALRNSVLAYKHFLETGEKKVNPSVFDKLYPEVNIES